MSNALVKYETDQGAVQLSPEIIKRYLVNGNGSVTDQEVTMFLNLCKYQKLNPFLREAYLIKFGMEPATIVTGKEVFTKRASKNNDCDGWESGVIVLSSGNLIYRPGTLVLKTEELVGGWCEVRRKDWSKPQRNEVSLSEYMRYKKDGTPMASWKSMPATMIRKVAIVQALRDAFPEDLQGLYSQEEMNVDSSNISGDVIVINGSEDMNDYMQKEQSDNMTVEEAATMKINFGKHKGKTLGEILKNSYDYVTWFMDNGTDPIIKKAFGMLVDAAKHHKESKHKPEVVEDNRPETGIYDLVDYSGTPFGDSESEG
jgi:phage recombination protein Bet